MRLWLSKNNEVPLREQLVTQIILGIVSNDLKARQRLPSTRELARRHRIHSNTVSAAYRELARRQWVEFRKGSGVYVRARGDYSDKVENLDVLISALFRTAREKGYSLAAVQAGLKRWLAMQPPDHFLLIESDPDLRDILVAEIEAATGTSVKSVALDELDTDNVLTGARVLTMYGQLEKVRSLLPTGCEVVALRSSSVVESMRGEQPPPADALVTVASCWPEFLRWAKAVLIAAGLNQDGINLTDARGANWKRALAASSLVISDSLTARELPVGHNVRVFRVLSDASRKELVQYADELRVSIHDYSEPKQQSVIKRKKRKG